MNLRFASAGQYVPDFKNVLLNFLYWRIVFESVHFIMEGRSTDPAVKSFELQLSHNDAKMTTPCRKT
ncbi:MAG TPA: hypothetical protein VFR80_13880 [Pyrinomonadaceae bacterium]|nr:hypothetical protein [Pyrinomonadaceae bacterium]